MDSVLMWIGFSLAAYSVVGNDVIQTLGTFLSSNTSRKWYQLWIFSASILAITLVYSWYFNNGDVSYHRLEKYPFPSDFNWTYVLPPLVLMVITRYGIPVSTSFLILTFFNQKNMISMIEKSTAGYVVALFTALLIYYLISKGVEKKFLDKPIPESEKKKWALFQWLTTGFLWGQWLIQDFANIYVYLPRSINSIELIISMFIILGLLAYTFKSRGGSIQKIVTKKTNTTDIRSATLIDLFYGIILYFFKEINNIPMSTTWVFIGLLAGRELAIKGRINNALEWKEFKIIGSDLIKIIFGLIVSVGLVYTMKELQ